MRSIAFRPLESALSRRAPRSFTRFSTAGASGRALICAAKLRCIVSKRSPNIESMRPAIASRRFSSVCSVRSCATGSDSIARISPTRCAISPRPSGSTPADAMDSTRAERSARPRSIRSAGICFSASRASESRMARVCSATSRAASGSETVMPLKFSSFVETALMPRSSDSIAGRGSAPRTTPSSSRTSDSTGASAASPTPSMRDSATRADRSRTATSSADTEVRGARSATACVMAASSRRMSSMPSSPRGAATKAGRAAISLRIVSMRSASVLMWPSRPENSARGGGSLMAVADFSRRSTSAASRSSSGLGPAGGKFVATGAVVTTAGATKPCARAGGKVRASRGNPKPSSSCWRRATSAMAAASGRFCACPDGGSEDAVTAVNSRGASCVGGRFVCFDNVSMRSSRRASVSRMAGSLFGALSRATRRSRRAIAS